MLLVLGASTAGRAQEEPEPAGYVYREASAIQEALEDVLSRPEFRRLRPQPEEEEEEEVEEDSESPEWLVRFLGWLAGLFDTTEASESRPSGFVWPDLTVLFYAAAALVLVAALAFISSSVVFSSRSGKIQEKETADARFFQPGAAPGEAPPEHYWSRALELAERQEFKQALRELLLGAMSAIERRGLIRYRNGLTNRDYLWSVRGQTRQSFATIAAHFERVYFGRRDATPEGFRECRRAYEKSFGAGAA